MGYLSNKTLKTSLTHGIISDKDLISSILYKQFQEKKFSNLSGGRVIFIAVHPKLIRMGYGTRAINLLIKYYSSTYTNKIENKKIKTNSQKDPKSKTESLKPSSKNNLRHLLSPLH